MPSRRWLQAFVVATSVVVASTAAADAIGPPTLQCPEGFPVKTCHGSEYCGLTRCTTDAECSAGSSCADQRWCIQKFDCSGRWRPDGYIPNYLYAYEGSCAKGESCAKGSCETIRACTPLVDRGCSCQVGGLAGAAPLSLLALLALLFLHRRRRT